MLGKKWSPGFALHLQSGGAIVPVPTRFSALVRCVTVCS